MKFTNKNRVDSSLQTYPKQSYLNKTVYKTGTTFWTPVNTLFISSSLLVLLASSAGIFSGIFSSFASSTSEAQDNFYPTSLPWIQDKSDCEYRGRTWKDGKCWDQEHSPMF
jgi:hypothetical protein